MRPNLSQALPLISSLLMVSYLLSPTVVQAQGSQIDHDASVFAVITHKAGLAAKLAHNHLVVAQGYDAALSLDPQNPAATSFRLDAPAAELVVDDSATQKAWYPRLAELGILDEPFKDIDDGDRGKIHKSMVGKKQLAVDKHPRILAQVLSVSEASGGPEGFPYSVELSIEIVGKTVKKSLAGTLGGHDGSSGRGSVRRAAIHGLRHRGPIPPCSAR